MNNDGNENQELRTLAGFVTSVMVGEGGQARALAAELQKAARNGNIRLVRQLLAKGADPGTQDVDGWTCLHAAAVEGHACVLRLLCGEDVRASTGTNALRPGGFFGAQPHSTAAPPDERPEVLVGQELVDVNILTACGRSALYLAALDGSAECVRVLLTHGADPSARSKEGKTPFDVAALFQRAEAQALLQSAMEAPRQPVVRRPKLRPGPTSLQESGRGKSASSDPIYVPPDPIEWRKADFTKWSKISDEDLDAIDAHQQRIAAEESMRHPRGRKTQRKIVQIRISVDVRGKACIAIVPAGGLASTASAPPTATSTAHEAQAAIADARARAMAMAQAHEACCPPGTSKSLPSGVAGLPAGPPKTLEVDHPRYAEYKEWLDIQKDLQRDRLGQGMSEDRLLSLKPPSEGGAAPDKNNGCHGMGYTWGQTPTEVQVWIVVARGTSKRDVACDIAPASLSVAVLRPELQGQAAVPENTKGRRQIIFKCAPLWKRIKVDDSVWTLEEGLLTVMMRKVDTGWWRCVTDMEGHTKIDTSLCRGPDMLNEYDAAEQEELRRFFDRQLSRPLPRWDDSP